MSQPDEANLPHVVIIGGGFGGLYAARALKREPVRVTLIDKRNHHLFQPLLYQVATAGLGAPDISAPIRQVLRKHKNTTVLLAKAERIDPEEKRIYTNRGTLDYDYLVVGIGLTHNYFGNDQWEEPAPGLKSLHDALDIRRRVLTAFEAAEWEEEPLKQAEHLTFVIVGGGPTGVEMAGALSEIARHTMARQFRRFDPAKARVILIEGQDRVLPTFDEESSEKALEQLKSLGVEVILGKLVQQIDDGGVEVDGRRIAAKTVVWAAGVKGRPLVETLDAPLDKMGRVKVEPDLSCPDHPHTFVVGDIAALTDVNGVTVPGLAPAAIQQGRHTARNIVRLIDGEETEPFAYKDKGNLATIGRSAAVAELGRFHFKGLLAWLLWSFVHIMFLVGFRNRASVMLDWMLSYFFYQRGARLILERPFAEGSAAEKHDELQQEEEEEPAKALPLEPPDVAAAPKEGASLRG